jgi:hypothetical protein
VITDRHFPVHQYSDGRRDLESHNDMNPDEMAKMRSTVFNRVWSGCQKKRGGLCIKYSLTQPATDAAQRPDVNW